MIDLRTFEGCHASATRSGELEACEKPAVAMTTFHTEETRPLNPWPVCAWHANRLKAVPLPPAVLHLMRGNPVVRIQ